MSPYILTAGTKLSVYRVRNMVAAAFPANVQQQLLGVSFLKKKKRHVPRKPIGKPSLHSFQGEMWFVQTYDSQ